MSKQERTRADIDDTKLTVFCRDNWTCVVCGARASQLGHILPQDKLHLARYGAAVIQHPLNMKAVCGLRCNAKVQINARSRPREADAHAATVRNAIEHERGAI